MDGKEIRKRLSSLESDRTVVQGHWDIIRQYVVPFRGQFFKDQTTESSVDWGENRKVYDSTAVQANNTLASSLQGSITSPSIQWFDFTYHNEELNNSKEAMVWLSESAKTVYESLRDSNFNLEANETYIDMTSFGTAFITKEILEREDQGFDDFLFQACPVHESYFEEDHRGRIINFYRSMYWSPLMIVNKFGDKVPENIKKRAAKGDNNKDVNIIFCVFKRKLDAKPDVTRILAPTNRPYGYKYILRDCGSEVGEEGGYYTQPAMVLRWRKTADSMWGNSPAMIALPDILTLNELVELILNSLEKVVDPAIMTTERGLISSLNLGPAGVNVLRKMDELAPFESRARFDVAELNREKLQSSIRSIFYVDQLELKDSPAMTATEVQVRYELMQRLLGPTLGRLESEFLNPLVMSSFADLMRYGRIPPPPNVVMESGDPSVLVNYTGPMARAQKLDQAASMERFAAGVANLAEVRPEVMDVPDWDFMVRNLAELLGVDPRSTRSTVDVSADRKARQAQEQAMRDATIQEQSGKADKAVGEGRQALQGV